NTVALITTAGMEPVPVITASTINANTSSTTAAARITWAVLVRASPRSFSTRAVMPTLVAVRLAATNACVNAKDEGNSQRATIQVAASDPATPHAAIASAAAPTFRISPTVDS